MGLLGFTPLKTERKTAGWYDKNYQSSRELNYVSKVPISCLIPQRVAAYSTQLLLFNLYLSSNSEVVSKCGGNGEWR